MNSTKENSLNDNKINDSNIKINDSGKKNSDEKYAIMFLVDQASPEAFFSMIDKGFAPSVTKYILGDKTKDGTYSNATISRNIITGYPSTSANSHVSLLMGSYQGKTDLLSAAFWNLTGKKPEFRNTEKVSISLLSDLNNKYISREHKMLFEHIPDSASFHGLNRGAKYKLLTTFGLMTKFLPLIIKVKRSSNPDGINPMDKPELWKSIFTKNISSFLKNVEKSGHLYKASFIVFLLTDGNAHKFGFGSDKYEEAVSLLDYFVKEIVEGIDTPKGHIKGLKELGYLDKIIWNICTDHAGRKIERDKYVAINPVTEIDLGLNLLEGQKEEEEKYLKSIKYDLSKINAFTEVSAELFHCWFGGPDGKETADFNRFYNEEFFRNIKPKRTHKTDNRDHHPVDLIEYYINKDFTQFVIIPEGEKTKDGSYDIKIFSKEGVGKVTRTWENNIANYTYVIIKGKDPLDYGDIGLEYGKTYNHELWLEKTLTKELPDVFYRLYGFFDCKYSPNFVLTSEMRYHFWSLYGVAKERDKKLLNVQTHDGLYDIESVVPLTFAGPGVPKGSLIKKGRNVDVLPTLLKLLNVKFDLDKMDGKPLL